MIKMIYTLKLRALLFLILLLSSFNTAMPQYAPQPINLPIENRVQNTLVWCWVAVAEQVISYLTGPSNTPSQCMLAETALRLRPGVCCNTGMCNLQPGTIDQIAGLISWYGRGYSNIMFSRDPYTVYNILRQGHPIIVSVNSGMGIGHVVVMGGMEWTPYGPILHINDPLLHLPHRIPYYQIAQYWMYGLEVF